LQHNWLSFYNDLKISFVKFFSENWVFLNFSFCPILIHFVILDIIFLTFNGFLSEHCKKSQNISVIWRKIKVSEFLIQWLTTFN